jgi:hypothetical protein
MLDTRKCGSTCYDATTNINRKIEYFKYPKEEDKIQNNNRSIEG